MSTDLKITELVETLQANTLVSSNTGGMNTKAHTYLRFREIEGLDFRSRLLTYALDHTLITVLSMLLWYSISFGYLFFWYVGIKILYFSIQEIYFQSSLGKMLFDAIVVDEYGQKPTIIAVLIRSVFRFFPFLIIWFDEYNLQERSSRTLLVTKEELKELLELKEKNKIGVENQDSNYMPETVNQYLALDEKEKLPKGITTRNINQHWSDDMFFLEINWELIDWDEEFLEQELWAILILQLLKKK